MAYPIKVCSVCSEEFELKPGKPGYANRCPACSESDSSEQPKHNSSSDARRSPPNNQLNAARRKAIRDLLYRKEG
jgi:hypothetical protein